MRRFGPQKGKSQVFLNVYDLHESNEYLYPLGFGSFHSGVQIGSSEYTFGGGSGLFTHSAKDVPNARFRESILLGEFEGNSRDIDAALDELRPQFPGTSYNLLMKNCNHFADAFSMKLLHKPIPEYVNRLAYVGSYFSCLLPPSVTGQAPVSDPSSSSSGGSQAGSVSGGRSMEGRAAAASFSTSKGNKLGQAEDQERVPLMEELDRRELMRQAALKRFDNTKPNS